MRTVRLKEPVGRKGRFVFSPPLEAANATFAFGQTVRLCNIIIPQPGRLVKRPLRLFEKTFFVIVRGAYRLSFLRPIPYRALRKFFRRLGSGVIGFSAKVPSFRFLFGKGKGKSDEKMRICGNKSKNRFFTIDKKPRKVYNIKETNHAGEHLPAHVIRSLT